MFFASDNASGASDKVLAALVEANAGHALPYGADPWTAAAEKGLQELFETDCAVFLVGSGTAANALALAAASPAHGAIFCHADSHIANDECGAPEFFTAGAKLVPLPGEKGRITLESFQAGLKRFPRGLVKQVQPSVLSLTQATESGTLYNLASLKALCDEAHGAGVDVHMDGARFANALVQLGCSPAEMSWKAGVDILSFGATKNGTLNCEAVVVFNKMLARELVFRRKRAGQTLSKSRFVGAQMCAYLEGGHWLDLAIQANAMAERLAVQLKEVPGVRLPWRTEVNEVFAILPHKAHLALKMEGAVYYDWGSRGLTPEEAPREDEIFVRLVTSFATTRNEVDRFAHIVREVLA